MAAEKAEKHSGKAHGRLLIKILTVMAAVAAIFIGMMIFFKVQKITVVGAKRYTTSEVQLASGIAIGENLMTLNKSEAVQNLYSRLPYIAFIRMDRRLPDTVLIEIEECEAAAVIQDTEGNRWLIGTQGNVLEPAAENDAEGLCLICGTLAQTPQVGERLILETEEQTSALQALLPELVRSHLLPEVRSVNLEKTYEMTLEYADQFHVLLGGTDQIEYKIRYLEEIACNQLGETRTGTIDLTLTESGVARFIPS